MDPQTGTSAARWGKAVVIGGAYAGLVTARVLADHFNEVVILERDPVDESTGVHPHVPQGYHAHAMLAKGSEILEKLFPGLRAELQDLGAPVYDYGERLSFFQPAGFAPRCRTGVRIQTFTRNELERSLRRRVLALPGVTLLASASCEGLAMGRSGDVVRVTYRADGSAKCTELDADLAVDASGRSSGLERWLADMGVPVPAKRVVKAKITYVSTSFSRPDDLDYDGAYQMAFAPGIPRGGVILGVERGRWMCSLFGFEDQAPPVDEQGYLDFARSLKNPRVAAQLEQGTDAEPILRYVNVNNQWNQYHKSKTWPERLLAVGDAVCVFNPVYGQGLTVAALEAALLHRLLAARRTSGKGLDGLSRHYQRRVARLLLVPWTLSSSSDLMWNPHGQPPSARIAHWYNKHLFAVAVRDAGVWTRFAKVANMVAPPQLLFHPFVVSKVVSQALSRGRS